MTAPDNHFVAEQLLRMAETLWQQGDRGFRPAAYRRAGDAIHVLEESLADILDKKGVAGLVALPRIGESIARSIAEILTTGHWAQLERVQGALDPEVIFQQIPGVGPQLAQRIHEGLGVDTLQQLEIAAHDGRLETIPNIGARRASEIRAALADMLGDLPSQPRVTVEQPPIDLLLAMDSKYRSQARHGLLQTIAPRRFNSSGKAWLPIMHSEHDPWRFTLMFSNTGRAHKLGKTSDWVVIYSQSDTAPESQSTVVTETLGALKGKRVVRGREPECASHYSRVAAHA